MIPINFMTYTRRRKCVYIHTHTKINSLYMTFAYVITFNSFLWFKYRSHVLYVLPPPSAGFSSSMSAKKSLSATYRLLTETCKEYVYRNYGYPVSRFEKEYVDEKLKKTYGPSRVHLYSENRRYLSPIPTKYEGGGCHFIKSQMGTGKTRQMNSYLRKFVRAHGKRGIDKPTMIMITPRKTFAKSQYYAYGAEFGFVCYDQCPKNKKFSKFTTPRLICQLQSLHRVDTSWTFNTRFDVLLLDEYCSVLQELVSDVTRHREAIYGVLRSLVQGAGRIICVDANLSEREIDAMRDLLDCADKCYLPTNFIFQVNRSAGMFERGLKIVFFEDCFLNLKPFFARELNELMRAIEGEKGLRPGLLTSVVNNANEFVTAISGEEDPYDLYVSWYLSSYRERIASVVSTEDGLSVAGLKRDIISELYRDLYLGKNAVVISTTKLALYRLDKLLGGRFKSVFITGDTPDEIKYAFCKEADFASLFRDVRLFGFTSAYKVGIDVNLEHFDVIYLLLDLSNPTVPCVGDVVQCLGRIRSNPGGVIKVHFLAAISRREIELTGLPTDEGCGYDIDEFLRKSLRRFDEDRIMETYTGSSTASGLKTIVKTTLAERKITEYPIIYLSCLIRLLRAMCLKKYSVFIGKDPCRGEQLVRALIQLDIEAGNRNEVFVKGLLDKKYDWFKTRIEDSYESVLSKCVRLTDVDVGRTNDTGNPECASELLVFASMMNDRSYILYPYLSVCVDGHYPRTNEEEQNNNDRPLYFPADTRPYRDSPAEIINRHYLGRLTLAQRNKDYAVKMVTSFVIAAFNRYQIDHRQYDSCIDVGNLKELGSLYKIIRDELLHTRQEDGVYVTDIGTPSGFYYNHHELIDSIYLAFYRKQGIRERDSNLFHVLKRVYGVDVRMVYVRIEDKLIDGRRKQKRQRLYRFDTRKMITFHEAIKNMVPVVKIVSTLKRFPLPDLTLEEDEEIDNVKRIEDEEGYFEFD